MPYGASSSDEDREVDVSIFILNDHFWTSFFI